MKSFIFLTTISLMAACGNTQPTETTTVESQAESQKSKGEKGSPKSKANKQPETKVEAVKELPTISACTNLLETMVNALDHQGASDATWDDACCNVPNFKSAKAPQGGTNSDSLTYASELGIDFCK